MSQRNTGDRVIPTRTRVQYTPQQWADKKGIITDLYAVQGRPLREVQEIMRTTYDFRPTDRMYQTKIKQWEINKKHKEPEMKAFLRLTRQREAIGQPSVFRIRGRRVDIEEVHHYFKRKGVDVRELDVRNCPIPSSIKLDSPAPQSAQPSSSAIQSDNDPVEISFRITPDQDFGSHPIPETDYRPFPNSGSPSEWSNSSYLMAWRPLARNDESHPTPETDYCSFPNSESPLGWSTLSYLTAWNPLARNDGTFAYQIIPDVPHIAPPMNLTFEDKCSCFLLALTQRFFYAVVRREFYSEVLPEGVKQQPWRRIMSSWSRATSEGYELLHRGQTQESFALRARAMDSVPKHIQNPSPIILFRYFEIIHAICASGDEAFLLLTLRHVLAISQSLLLAGHPIRELTRLFLHPQVRSIIGPLAHQGISKSLQILYEECHETNPRILYVLDSRTQTFLDERQYEHASDEARRYLERAQAIRGDTSFEACQARRMLGDVYIALDRHDDAVEAYRQALTPHRHLRSPEDRGLIGVKAQRGLALIARSQGRYSDACDLLQVGLQMATDAFGDDDPQAILIRKDLDALTLHQPG